MEEEKDANNRKVGNSENKKQAGIIGKKTIVIEMKNAFDGLLSKLDMAEEKKMSELQEKLIETSKMEKQRKTIRLENEADFIHMYVCMYVRMYTHIYITGWIHV